MGDAAAELPHRLHALRHRELRLSLAQDALRLHALGNVPRNLRESDDLSGVIADRVDDDRGPESAAVLAHAPSLGFEPPLARRRRERPLGKAGGLVLLGVELAEVPAYDLVGGIELDAFGAAVPGGDDAVLVELEDRIIHHRVDEVAEPALAFEEPALL